MSALNLLLKITKPYLPSVRILKLCITRKGKFEELLVTYAIKTKNFEEFENAYKRLKIYNEETGPLLPKSGDLDKITALYLLYLLSFNR
jgi:hypothetical protein